MFLDSDDWMEDNTVETAVSLALEHDAQMISWNHYFNYEKNISRDVPNKAMPAPVLLYEKKAIREHLLYDMVAPEFDQRLHNTYLGEVRAVWAKLFSAGILKENRILFEEKLVIGEDACFNFDVLKNIDKAVFVNQYLNHYRICSDSVNHRSRADIVEIRLELLKNYRIRFDENDRLFSLCYTRDVLSSIVNCLSKYYCVHFKSMPKMRKELVNLLSNEYIKCVHRMECDPEFFNRSERILLKMIRQRNAVLLLAIGKAIRFVRR